jgi:hypothetical protein
MQAILQAARDVAQQRVADRMAQVVVDAFEAIQIEIQERRAFFAALGRGQRAVHVTHQHLAVRQARQCVEIGQILNARLGGLALADVANDDQVRPVELREHARLEGAGVRVVAHLELVCREFAGRMSFGDECTRGLRRGLRHRDVALPALKAPGDLIDDRT